MPKIVAMYHSRCITFVYIREHITGYEPEGKVPAFYYEIYLTDDFQQAERLEERRKLPLKDFYSLNEARRFLLEWDKDAKEIVDLKEYIVYREERPRLADKIWLHLSERPATMLIPQKAGDICAGVSLSPCALGFFRFLRGIDAIDTNENKLLK